MTTAFMPSNSTCRLRSQVITLFWFHIMYGQVMFRVVGFPAHVYPHGPSSISLMIAMYASRSAGHL